MADYCQVSFGWKTERDFHHVIDYCVEQPGETDRNSESNVNALLLPGRLDLFSESSDGEHSSVCTLKLKCKPMYKVAIKGLDIVSEARTLEIYDDIDGYLQSVKGVPIPGCEEDQMFYITSFEIKDSTTGIEIKFLSLGERLSFQIRQIRITLVQQETRPDRSKLDMVRLKNHIAGLGSQVSDRAKSLFETMEQYQKNQQGVLGGVQNLLSMTSMCSDKESTMSGLAGLLSTFSHLKQQQKNPLVDLASNGTSKEEDECNEKSDPSKLADNMLSGMMSGADSGDTVNSDDMYKFLQSVCGRVTKMREKTELENKEQDDLTNTEVLQGGTISTTIVDPAVMTELVNQLKVAEERIVRRVERRMTQMEDRINRKLDRILQALQIADSDNSGVQYTTSSNIDDNIQLD
ncbi:ATPase PAAT-like [Gigantopelta aegis]|uniref:ATPase PAAT-like n=1 Tax=Gigantopelta aegis TaxID=1735272 RepID=UPI001B88DACE|nr:ATPase PAAT-like [Gigantopelta aegis]